MSSQTVITLTGDEASAYKAFQKIIEQSTKLNEATKKVGKEAKTSQLSFDNVGSSVTGLVSSYFSLSGAMQLVSRVQSEMIAVQERALEMQTKLARAQESSLKNMPFKNASEIRQNTAEAERIASETGFSDISLIDNSLANLGSIVGDERAKEIVKISAGLSRLNKNEIGLLGEAFADIANATRSEAMAEVASLVVSGQSVARQSSMSAFASGLAPVLDAARLSLPNQPSVDLQKEATALYSLVGQMDPSGRTSSSAATTFVNTLKEVFVPTPEAQRQRDDEIARLQAGAPGDQASLERARFNLAEFERLSATFTDPTSPQALENAIDLSETKAKILELENRQRANRERLDLLTAERNAAANDPGTLLGRLEIARGNKALRDKLLSSIQGESTVKPRFQGLVSDDATFAEFRRIASGISADPQQIAKLFENQNANPQMRMALAGEGVAASIAVNQSRNTPAAAVAKAAQIESDVLAETALGTGSTLVNVMSMFERQVSRMTAVGDEEQFLNNRLSTLRQRRQFLENDPGLFDPTRKREVTPQLQTQLRITDEGINAIKALIEEVKQFRQIQSEANVRLDANTQEVKRNNEILAQDVQTNNTGTIQAQQERRK